MSWNLGIPKLNKTVENVIYNTYDDESAFEIIIIYSYTLHDA